MSKRPANTRPERATRVRRRSTTVPDILFCLAAAALTMAAIFVITSFTNDDGLGGDAGKTLARAFAAALAFSGLFVGALGFGLLRDDRGDVERYVFPIALGILIGGIEAMLFLAHATSWIWVPFLLVLLAVRPVRKLGARLLGQGRR